MSRWGKAAVAVVGLIVLMRFAPRFVGGSSQLLYQGGSLLFLLAIVVLGVFFYRAVGKTEHTISQDDAEALREINQGLARMEERIESLETLLQDHQHDGKGQ